MMAPANPQGPTVLDRELDLATPDAVEDVSADKIRGGESSLAVDGGPAPTTIGGSSPP